MAGFDPKKGKYLYSLFTIDSKLSDVDLFTFTDNYYMEFEVKHHKTQWKVGNTFLTKERLDHYDIPAFSLYTEIPSTAECLYVDGKITDVTNSENTRNAVFFVEDTVIKDVVFNNKCTEQLKEEVKYYKGLSVGCFLKCCKVI